MVKTRSQTRAEMKVTEVKETQEEWVMRMQGEEVDPENDAMPEEEFGLLWNVDVGAHHHADIQGKEATLQLDFYRFSWTGPYPEAKIKKMTTRQLLQWCSGEEHATPVIYAKGRNSALPLRKVVKMMQKK